MPKTQSMTVVTISTVSTAALALPAAAFMLARNLSSCAVSRSSISRMAVELRRLCRRIAGGLRLDLGTQLGKRFDVAVGIGPVPDGVAERHPPAERPEAPDDLVDIVRGIAATQQTGLGRRAIEGRRLQGETRVAVAQRNADALLEVREVGVGMGRDEPVQADDGDLLRFCVIGGAHRKGARAVDYIDCHPDGGQVQDQKDGEADAQPADTAGAGQARARSLAGGT